MRNNRATGIFFAQLPLAAQEGIIKKVRAQARAFRKAGFDLHLAEVPFDIKSKTRKNFYFRQIVSRLPFSYIYSKIDIKKKHLNMDFYYFRYIALDYHFISTLRKLKKANKKSILIIEMPDWPANGIWSKTKLMKILFAPMRLKHAVYRRQVHRYVDRIAIPQDGYRALFDIPVIRFRNGCDVDTIVKRHVYETKEIHAIAVAGMFPVHGYDRFIEGLHHYYARGGKREVFLHLVGGTDRQDSEISDYRRRIQKYKLEDHVIIHGTCDGEELDRIYNQCNIAVGVLGLYRSGFQITSALKYGEYLAKGLPVVCAGEADVFRAGSFQRCLYYPNDKTPLDMERMIAFFDQTYGACRPSDFQRVADEIRKYAEEYADNTAGMKPIFDYIEKEHHRRRKAGRSFVR